MGYFRRNGGGPPPRTALVLGGRGWLPVATDDTNLKNFEKNLGLILSYRFHTFRKPFGIYPASPYFRDISATEGVRVPCRYLLRRGTCFHRLQLAADQPAAFREANEFRSSSRHSFTVHASELGDGFVVRI